MPFPTAAGWTVLVYGCSEPVPDGDYPPSVSAVASAQSHPLQALRAWRAQHPRGSVVLLKAGTWLPPHAWTRLAHYVASSDAHVISPLGSGPLLSPLPEAERCAPFDPADVDRAVALRGVRQRLPSAHWLPELSVWREAALDWLLANPEFDGSMLPDTLRGEVCAQLFVAGVVDALCGPQPSADERFPRPADALDALRARFAPLPGPFPAYAGIDSRPVVLHIVHGWGGGALGFVQDLARADEACVHLALMAEGDAGRGRHGERLLLRHAACLGAPLRAWPLLQPIAGTASHAPQYQSILGEICSDYAVDAVLISSLIGHSLDALRTGLPTWVVMHDFYPLWPVLHAPFQDPEQNFDAAALERILERHPQPFAGTSAGDWVALREAYVSALEQAGAQLIIPSAWIRETALRMAPRLQGRTVHLVAHGLRPFPQPVAPREPPSRERPRVLVLGRIHGDKGLSFLRQAIPALSEEVSFYLLGCGNSGEAFFGHPGVDIELDYVRDDLPRLLARIAPDMALIASSVPETFSYTLSELWALGVPVAALALGSFVDRVHPGRDGWLLPVQPDAAIAQLRRLAADRAAQQQVRNNLRAMRWRDTTEMVRDYRALWNLPVRDGIRYSLRPAQPTVAELALAEAERMRQAAKVARLQEQAEAQRIELEARADWALRTEGELHRRTRWAQSLQQENADVRRDFEAQSAELDAQRQECQQLRHSLEAAEHQAASLHQQQHELNQRLQTIYVSRSWRWTAPMRHISGWVRSRHPSWVFRARQAFGLGARFVRSLRQRGVRDTMRRVWRWLRPEVAVAPIAVAAREPAGTFAPFAVPGSDAPVVSVIIPAFNHFAHTHNCLRSLAEHASGLAHEIIVVDDCSHDETPQRLGEIAGVRVVRNPRNLGFIGACNAGAAQARGSFLVFLNNDTRVTEGWLEALWALFEERSDCGLVGAKLVYPDGRLQEAGGIVFQDASGWNYGRFDDPQAPAYNYVREVDYCSGAAIMIRRVLFEELGGFDACYAPAYYEDTDLAFRVRAAGLKAYYQPRSQVIHYEGISSGTDVTSGTKRFQPINQEKFRARWEAVLRHHPAPGTPIWIARQHRVRARFLVVDACVPTPDQDSGSLRMVNLLRLLVELGAEVRFVAENRAWDAKYTPPLQQLGVEALYGPWVRDIPGWLAEHGAGLDWVILSRHYVASPLLPLVRRHAPRARVVFDTVDLHYLREEREAELHRDARLRAAAKRTQAQELHLVRDCDITWVVSPVERELLQRECPGARVEVLSNVHEVVGSRTPWAQRRDIWFVGGFQHVPNQDAVLWFAREVWPLVLRRLPDLNLHVVGSRAPEAIRALAGGAIQVHGFVEDLSPFLQGCRLAIAPLRYGAGVKGKVNQAMACGQPVVATSVAVEGMHLRDQHEVLVADEPEAFAQAVARLYEDEELWDRLSAAAVENVRRNFSFAHARAVLQRYVQPGAEL